MDNCNQNIPKKEKGNNNLHFFISILFRQPRLEYALHHLAYENNYIKNFTEKIWIPHLIYKIFNEKQKEENPKNRK